MVLEDALHRLEQVGAEGQPVLESLLRGGQQRVGVGGLEQLGQQRDGLRVACAAGEREDLFMTHVTWAFRSSFARLGIKSEFQMGIAGDRVRKSAEDDVCRRVIGGDKSNFGHRSELSKLAWRPGKRQRLNGTWRAWIAKRDGQVLAIVSCHAAS